MPEHASIDEILRAGARREARAQLQLGLLLVGAGLAVLFGLHALISSPGISIYVAPVGAIGFGVTCLVRALLAPRVRS